MIVYGDDERLVWQKRIAQFRGAVRCACRRYSQGFESCHPGTMAERCLTSICFAVCSLSAPFLRPKVQSF
jgi:hypothetical protein